jgi:hypothetical protein
LVHAARVLRNTNGVASIDAKDEEVDRPRAPQELFFDLFWIADPPQLGRGLKGEKPVSRVGLQIDQENFAHCSS